jgi:signal transduction histidine kinase
LRYLARELHDEVGQVVTGLRLALDMALKSAAKPAAGLVKAHSLADTLKGLVRELSRKLRPPMLDDLGLFPTLRWMFDHFSTYTNIQVLFEHNQSETRRFSHVLEAAIYRIVQEALTNVARHAKVSSATVRLWSNEQIIGIQIEDHGVGFDFPSITKEGKSDGLNVMRERVTLLGGHFSIDTKPGEGTRLTAEIPVD